MNRWLKVLFTAVVLGLTVGVIFRVHVATKQREANAAVVAYAARMQPVFSADGRFRNVVVYRFGGFGCAKYYGNVVSDEDLAALYALIDRSTPPENIQVVRSVKVGPADPAATQGLQ